MEGCGKHPSICVQWHNNEFKKMIRYKSDTSLIHIEDEIVWGGVKKDDKDSDCGG